MSLFALPALVALILKIWVYALAKKSDQSSQTFLWLLVFFAMHNLSEFLVIAQFFENQGTINYLLRFYYVGLIFSLAYMCIFATTTAHQNNHNRHDLIILSVAVLFSLVMIQTDLVIAGSSAIGYTVTAIKGHYYFLFQFIVLLGFVRIFYVLIHQYLTTLNIQVQLKCFYAMFALSPIIVISTLVMLMMHLGYPYTAALILPFASTLVLLIVVLSHKHNDLINIRGRLPFSAHRAAERQLVNIYRSFANEDLGLNQAKRDIERIFIQSALDRSGNNVSQAAARLKIKRSSLYSIFNRLEIERQDTDQ